MLLFCPSCSNVLTVSPVPHSNGPDGQYSGLNRLECLTCPYQYLINKRYYERKYFARTEKEDVFGGSKAWDNAQKTEVQCPNGDCNGSEAAFYQVQIRSADEPMTSFFKCMTCGNRWREN